MNGEMISIFNGRRRTLGAGSTSTIYAQVSVQLREHLYEFKDSSFIVFMAICLHSDENGEAWPSQKTLMRETGLGRDTICKALAFLREMTLNGDRVMVSHQQANNNGTFGSSRYLIFPTADEIAFIKGLPMQDEPCMVKPCTDEPDTVKAGTKKSQSKAEPKETRTSVCKEEPPATDDAERRDILAVMASVDDAPASGEFAHASEPTEKELLELDRAFDEGKFGHTERYRYRFNRRAYDKYEGAYRALHLSGYTPEQVKQGVFEMGRGGGKFSMPAMVTPDALVIHIRSFLPSAQPEQKAKARIRQFSKEDEI